MSIQIARLYSLIKFLENVEEGDSLTDIERKTQMSNVTIQGIVKDLESSALLSTRWRRTSRGKIRECTDISKPAKILATQLVKIIEGADYFLEMALKKDFIDYPNPLVFQMMILHKILENMSQSIDREISREAGEFFREWVSSSGGTISELRFFGDLIDKMLKSEDSLITRRGESIYFNPEAFIIYVDLLIGKSETENSKVGSPFEKRTSRGEVAIE